VICPSGGLVESTRQFAIFPARWFGEKFLRLTPSEGRIQPDGQISEWISWNSLGGIAMLISARLP
jgi:hypothetical protein